MARKSSPTGDDSESGASYRVRSLEGVAQAMHGLVGSPEPAVVLSSLARSSNPAFSDVCSVELSEGVEGLFQVTFPMADEQTFPASSRLLPATGGALAVTGNTVCTPFQAASAAGYPAFAGVVLHSWAVHAPTEDDAIIAWLLVDRALTIVRQERLAESAAQADDRAAKLAHELITSRVVGEATGILMTKYNATREEALSLLRRATRWNQHTLHEVDADLVHARGDIGTAQLRHTNGPVHRANLRSVEADS
jgi:ANTAR domain